MGNVKTCVKNCTCKPRKSEQPKPTPTDDNPQDPPKISEKPIPGAFIYDHKFPSTVSITTAKSKQLLSLKLSQTFDLLA
jgi:hypothetical protein